MKLVVDLRLINASGIGTYLKQLMPPIIAAFKNVAVLGNKEELLAFEWAQKVDIIPFNSKVYLFSEQLEYVLKIPQCDVYWCPHFNTPLLPIKAKKIIATIHDVNHLARPKAFSKLAQLWAKVLYKNTVKKSHAIITVSQFSKSEILKYLQVDEQKIHVIYLGVSKAFFSEIHKHKAIIPYKYILFVGNVKPHKNIITLLKAYNILPKTIKDTYKLVILGKREGFITSDNTVFNYIETHNLKENIVFTGYVPDNSVPNIYANAALFVFPSLYEGFGLPILEAMAAHIPIISSNAASLPEIGGQAAVYFDPLNADQLQHHIVNLIHHKTEADKLILLGNTQAQKFIWEETSKHHINLFNQLF